MSGGAPSLGEIEERVVVVACRWCPRRGRYRKATLIERYGPDVKMPDLLNMIAADCPKLEKRFSDRCGVYYPEV